MADSGKRRMEGATVVTEPVGGKARRVERMFSRIVRRYDLMNSLMTGGRDRSWRQLAVERAQPEGGLALDIGTGTGELALELLRRGARAAVGVDFSSEMLATARAKVEARGTGRTPHFLVGDALCLPFPESSFDVVISGFVVRNLADLKGGFREMRRVLRPGGRVVCLELTHPQPGAFARLFRFYFYRLVPLLGGVVTRDFEAYRYLPNSLSAFPAADDLAHIMTEAGLREVDYRLLASGTVAVHRGRRA